LTPALPGNLHAAALCASDVQCIVYCRDFVCYTRGWFVTLSCRQTTLCLKNISSLFVNSTDSQSFQIKIWYILLVRFNLEFASKIFFLLHFWDNFTMW